MGIYMKKIELFHNYYRSILISKTRFKLTILGMTISFFLFFICVLFYDTYVNQLNTSYENFKNDLIIIGGNHEFTLDEQIYFNNNFNKSQLTYYTGSYQTVIIHNNQQIGLEIQGCTPNFYNNYLISTNYGKWLDGNPIVEKREMLLGGSWNYEDNENQARVVVINELAARLFFFDENPLNKYIEIKNYLYKVVGVVANSSDLNEYLKKESSKNGIPSVEIFMPVKTFNKRIFNCGYTSVLINGNQYSKEDVDEFVFAMEQLNFKVYSRTKVDKAISQAIQNVLPMMISIMSFLGVISIMFLLNTMFFNTKEKIPEFGIRMALGARKIDIIKQIIFEGVLYSLISISVSLYVFFVFILTCQIIILKKVTVFTKVYVDFYHFGIVIILLFVIEFLFSLIPAFKIIKMKVIDAIKFE